jgi:hypothetical protein
VNSAMRKTTTLASVGGDAVLFDPSSGAAMTTF